MAFFEGWEQESIKRKEQQKNYPTRQRKTSKRANFLKPRQPMKTHRQITRESIKKAGLHETKAQRRAYQEALAKALGYKPAKLSDMVAKPSRYTVNRRVVVFDQRGKPTGEKLIVKRLAKRGQGKGGGRGERASHVTGSAVARKAAAQRLGGTRGERPKREKRKKKK